MSTVTNPEASEIISNSDRVLNQSPAEQRVAALARLLNLAQVSRLGGAIETLQNQAAARIPELAIPSTRDEAWRFTDLSKLVTSSFALAPAATVVAADIESLMLPDTHRLVFVDGVYAEELSDLGGVADTVTVGNGAALAEDTPIAKLPGADEVFTTLNTASFRDIAVVQAARNTVLDQPLHLLFVTTAKGAATYPRTLVMAETGSRLTLIEDYISLGEGQSFTNAVTEIVLQDNAEVQHSLIQRDSDTAFFIGKTSVIQSRDSRYTNIAVHVGGSLARHNLELHHQGTQVESNLYGLAIASGNRLVDTHSNIQYREPHCQSNQLYKAIAADKGRSVFNGRVDVPQKAQRTNAAQLNRNLLLSNRARIDTKPQLEIVADDVKCTHGATVSQLEDDQLFYLQSRGVDREAAQKLLIEAFALEILKKLPSEQLREALSASVMQLTAESAESEDCA